MDDLDIGVVTTAWGDYGRFLPDWIASVQAQIVQPTRVTILDAGLDDPGPACEVLAGSGLAWRVVIEPYRGMGHARNAAIEATPTEWVMHLDADDMLLPHALADVSELAPIVDVVSLGALQDGKPRCFPRINATKILAQQHGVFSCGAYRRSLWQRRPYIVTNDYIDSPLWVGFAHLGARFTGTSRPGFIYRQHDGSFSHRMHPAQRNIATRQWLALCQQWDDQYTDSSTSYSSSAT